MLVHQPNQITNRIGFYPGTNEPITNMFILLIVANLCLERVINTTNITNKKY